MPINPAINLDLRVVEGIHNNDPDAAAELWEFVRSKFRYIVLRSFGVQDYEDKLCDAFVILWEAIRDKKIEDYTRVFPYMRSILYHLKCQYIREILHDRMYCIQLDIFFDEDHNASNMERFLAADSSYEPNHIFELHEHIATMHHVLGLMNKQDAELLHRYYIREEEANIIMQEMRLTPTQYRLRKNRAKNEFSRLGRRVINARPFQTAVAA